MNSLRPSLQVTALIVMALGIGPGCTTLSSLKREMAEQPPRRKQRKEEVVAAFEAKRDAARLEAALNRWNEGNEAACHQQLASLVKGKPQFVDARLQFAELLLYRGELDEARQQLRAALELAPQRADLHDCLGRVLEAASQHDEALVHFHRAAELEPDNVLYRSPGAPAAAANRVAASRAPK
jgi:Tfp pilus assembly protein PilF